MQPADPAKFSPKGGQGSRARRIAILPPYFFASLSQTLDELKRKGVDLIRMDLGSPDMPPPPFVIEAMTRAAARPDTHGYSPHGGLPAFREAVATYYGRRFGVELDPAREVLGLIGSKEGIFNLALAFINPGDAALVPDPGYPVYRMSVTLAGGEAVPVPLRAEADFLPDLDSIPADHLRRAKLLWVNYPNNPTTGVASLAALERLVEFARANRILLCHDAPYMDVTFDGYRAPSLLQVPGASEVAVEFNSLSKTYNMAGWRLGMAVGNAQVIKALADLKSNIDSGHFAPMMAGGIAALTGDQGWIKERNRRYQERRDIVLAGLERAGLQARQPAGSMYVWMRMPAGWSSADFCTALLGATGVSLTPGPAFGARGEGYVRISLGVSTDRVREAMDRLVHWRTKIG